MNALRLTPVVISLLLLGAHFMRHNLGPLVALPLILIGLLGVKRPWVTRLIQSMLVLGALEWFRAMTFLVMARQGQQLDWGRSAIILSAVTLFTLFSALVFQTKGLRQRYGFD
jgi:hypothetical protein